VMKIGSLVVSSLPRTKGGAYVKFRYPLDK
jgi:hypothetical protein